ncbi:hypothetical protein EBN03_01030 [Nocardia stercoris]|uniref:DUF6542 domain-containing protein n=1 Tax=Nocardia stercoris TaxID=2483361 RepID=A0A3M2LDX9_9NOCA|nr:hypothetical protein EBN03_01030 [Nocardia stercoris]
MRSDVPASHQSIIPTVPGLPAGGAVAVAVVCALIGFTVDVSGSSRELTTVFDGFYLLGCGLAPLVVRYRGLFTTMVTPPLLLFVTVPLAYQILLGHTSTAAKDIVLNLAVPLVNRFPQMALATLLALAIGLARLVLHRSAAGQSGTARRPASTRTGGSRTGTARSTASSARSASGRSRRTESSTGRAGTDTPARRRPNPAADREAPPQRQSRHTPERPSGGERPRMNVKTSYPRTATPVEAAAPAHSRTSYPDDLPPHPQPNVRYR